MELALSQASIEQLNRDVSVARDNLRQYEERLKIGLSRELDVQSLRRGVADQEVQLDPLPTLRERSVYCGIQIFLTDELVDDPSHAPRARFGGEGESAATGPLQFSGNSHPEGVHSQARQGDRDGDRGRRGWPGAGACSLRMRQPIRAC